MVNKININKSKDNSVINDYLAKAVPNSAKT
jgi:hypothetical protein